MPTVTDPMALSQGASANSAPISKSYGKNQSQYSTNANGYNQQAAYDQFGIMFGRDPTSAELAQITPYFKNESWGTDTAPGMAMIAQLYNQQQNTPQALYAKQQSDALSAYNKNPGQYDAQTNQIFQQEVGRNATSDELSHFGSLLASGQADQYGVGQLLGQSQEAQNYQTQQYQTQLGNNLQQTQSDYYNKYIMPDIQNQFAAQGRTVNDSGLAGALAQAAQQQNYGLQQYLAQFGAGQYGQSAQNQQNVYNQYLQNQYGLQNANIAQQLSNQNYNQGQNNNWINFNMQQQAYQNYLNQYGQRNSGLGQMIGGIAGGAIGAGIGAYAGGPQGAGAGYQIGSGLGSGLGSAASGGTQRQTGYGYM